MAGADDVIEFQRSGRSRWPQAPDANFFDASIGVDVIAGARCLLYAKNARVRRNGLSVQRSYDKAPRLIRRLPALLAELRLRERHTVTRRREQLPAGLLTGRRFPAS